MFLWFWFNDEIFIVFPERKLSPWALIKLVIVLVSLLPSAAEPAESPDISGLHNTHPALEPQAARSSPDTAESTQWLPGSAARRLTPSPVLYRIQPEDDR